MHKKSVMHVQSCCFACWTYCCFDVLVVVVAGENIRFSSLFPAEDGEGRGETNAGKSEDKQRMFSQAIAVVASLSPQPRPQGFSLKKFFEGKALGTRLLSP